MSRSGPEAIGGRFAVTGDVAVVVQNLQYLGRTLWRGGGKLPLPEDQLWVPALDRETGASVRVVPRQGRMLWGDDVGREAAARVVMRMGLPGVVPVLHAGPGVVYAEPGVGPGWPELGLGAAAVCVVKACEVAARLNAAGLGHLPVGPSHVRVPRGGDIAWILPAVQTLAVVDMHTVGSRDKDREVQERAIAEAFGGAVNQERWSREAALPTVWDLAWMFFILAWDEAIVAGERVAAVARVVLERPLEVSAAELAGLLVPLTPEPAVWAERVAALPVVRTPPRLPLDWDLVIADGEAVRATPAENMFLERHPQYVTVPLAGAYHQRASVAFNNCAYAEALVDATRAVELDDTVGYRTTRAVILDALGRGEEARAEIDAAFATPPLRPSGDWYRGALATDEEARVYAARGVIGLRARGFAEAEADLRRAWELQPTAARAGALGAALYGLGRVDEAVVLEAIAVAAAPEDAGLRWGLIVSLVRLGRTDEARGHAEVLLRVAPGVFDERVGRALGG